MNEKDSAKLHEEFIHSDRKHILMITNHGVHEWDVISGLPDTGGQDVYVNQLTDVLADFGFKVTIANRGGYPHPQTGEMRTGFRYKTADRRIVYTEDSVKEFVRKEDMKSHIPELVDFLYDTLSKADQGVDLIISNYWDAALLGVQLNERLEQSVPHLWIPHSLGAIKKRNMPPESWEKLRIDERIETEKEFIPKLDHVAATSSLIRESMRDDYGRNIEQFLPPCIDPERYYPRTILKDDKIWDFLAEKSGESKESLQNNRFIIEISRTDKTKRKDVLIRAFARVHEKLPETRLIVALEKSEPELYQSLIDLMRELKVEDAVIPIGHEAERLPYLYALTSVYCSPSVMEGFGMSVQEAAATAVPVVGSDKIPFVSEYLLGEEPQLAPLKNNGESGAYLQIGEGAIEVPADQTDGFSQALLYLLDSEEERKRMGRKALEITVPYFTWEMMTRRMLNKMGVTWHE
ncbi:MAG: glycosyltransferase [Spirochaetaceae bacterium]|nr:glycosyltransferase [Spirochaetaceae bacterium]MCF7949303.1 glycosyltransferase [Spirochaetia bacterium]MCF7951746.1 glycosyltransferase [Spirochaetaceae bacterium]